MWHHIYDNPLLVTTLPCIAALLALVGAQWSDRFARVYGSAFALGIAADAWLNGPYTPVRAGTSLATAVGVFFVIFGDFRYFVVIEHALRGQPFHGMKPKLGLVRAAGWAFVVPLGAQLVRWTFPRLERDERGTFLLYEVLFVGLLVGTWLFRLPHGSASARLSRRATMFELAQYVLWAGADVGILMTGQDAFFAMRLAANLMYYVAFVPTMLVLLRRKEQA